MQFELYLMLSVCAALFDFNLPKLMIKQKRKQKLGAVTNTCRKMIHSQNQDRTHRSAQILSIAVSQTDQPQIILINQKTYLKPILLYPIYNTTSTLAC